MKKYNVQLAGLVLFSAIFASGVAIGMEKELPELPSDVTKIIAQKTLKVYLDELEEINAGEFVNVSGQLMIPRERTTEGKGFMKSFFIHKVGAPIDMIIVLIENGANSNTKSYKGNTALHLLMNQIAFLRIGRNEGFLSNDSNRSLNSKDIHDLLAVQSKIQQLVKHKININEKNKEGDTAAHILFYNILNMNEEVVIPLLKFLNGLGVDMTIKNDKGLTLCDMARQHWGQRQVRFLEEERGLFLCND